MKLSRGRKMIGHGAIKNWVCLIAIIVAGVVLTDRYQGNYWNMDHVNDGRISMVSWKCWGLIRSQHQVRYSLKHDMWEFDPNQQSWS